jgi:hypothetical protein
MQLPALNVAAQFRATEDLGPIFLAGSDSWKVVSRVRALHEQSKATVFKRKEI